MTQSFGAFTDVVEGWLARAPAEEDPESVLARIVAELDSTPQQRWPWIMSRFDARVAMGFGFGAAATVLAVVVGAQLLDLPSGAGDRAPGPTAPATDVGDIAFVQATYANRGDLAEDVRILAIPSEGGDPALLGVPAGNEWRRSRGQFPDNDRNLELVGPAVSWSPDGTRIAFRLFNDAPGIYLMNRDGTGLRRLVDLPLDRNTGMGFSAALDWSPDGTRIAYSYPHSDIRSPLYVIDAADRTVANLTGPAADGVTRTVAWSPDGSMIAFVRSDVGGLPRGSALFVMDAEGTVLRQLPTGSEPNPQVTGVAWSPDSSMIAFRLDMGSATDPAPHRHVLRVINADGTGMHDLAEPAGSGCCTWSSTDERLAWSPDGTSVAFIRWTEAGRDVVVVNVDGSGERGLTRSGDFSWFDWSPDGSLLVVFDQESYEISVVNADGSGWRWLANGEFPAWAPAPGNG
ncbi:MAG TPA: hypothetical protein VF365_13205 [Candidatus Limnocylindria bacterium]